MYEEYLGEGYHDRVRTMLTVDDVLLPNEIIDADFNIGSMKELVVAMLKNIELKGGKIDTEEKMTAVTNMAVYFLCGVLCMAMKSRTSVEPFDIPKYKKQWDKKLKKYMSKGNEIALGLIPMG